MANDIGNQRNGADGLTARIEGQIREQGAGELLACPFCGGKAKPANTYGYPVETVCLNCGAAGSRAMSAFEAERKWNTRQPDSERIEELGTETRQGLSDECDRLNAECNALHAKNAELEREVERLRDALREISEWYDMEGDELANHARDTLASTPEEA